MSIRSDLPLLIAHIDVRGSFVNDALARLDKCSHMPIACSTQGFPKWSMANQPSMKVINHEAEAERQTDRYWALSTYGHLSDAEDPQIEPSPSAMK